MQLEIIVSSLLLHRVKQLSFVQYKEFWIQSVSCHTHFCLSECNLMFELIDFMFFYIHFKHEY